MSVLEAIQRKWPGLSEDGYPRCVFDGRVCSGESTMIFVSAEQVLDSAFAIPRGAHVSGLEYYVCDCH